MDHTDSEILILLQKNARISMSEISSHVNLSVSAVSERLKKLDQNKLVSRYTAILNPAAFNKNLLLFIRMETTADADRKAIEEFILNEPDIIEFHYLAGRSDALLKVWTQDVPSLDRLMRDLKALPGIGSIRADLITSSPKADVSICPPVV